MTEGNPYIERFSAMSPEELGQQFERLKELFPSGNIILDTLLNDPTVSAFKAAENALNQMMSRRGTELLIQMHLRLNALKPQMLVTDFFKRNLSERATTLFEVGIENPTQHLIKILYKFSNLTVDEAQGKNLFLPDKSSIIEQAVYNSQRFILRLGNIPTSATSTEWEQSIKEYHGTH